MTHRIWVSTLRPRPRGRTLRKRSLPLPTSANGDHLAPERVGWVIDAGLVCR